jgi:8-oxo-dGTP pyrophosphatase MutT (NUDIX family)
MAEVFSYGFLIFRRLPEVSFLLMQHADRWDLPKGHREEGETEMQCALRELHEETGIREEDIAIDPAFRFTSEYEVRCRRLKRQAGKLTTIFLAWLESPVTLTITEHLGYEWFAWRPPHRIQQQTVDPLLAQAEAHLADRPR